jgi:hypothetical protein
MGTPEKNPQSVLPKISKNLAYRTLFLIVVVGGLAYGLEWFLKHRTDLGALRTSDTVGWISAVEYLPDGYRQAVLIDKEGKIHKDPGYVSKTNDRDVTWSPHGNFLYFVSDRAEHNFNLFRWTPGGADPSEQRTIGTRARGNLRFPAQLTNEPDGEARGLLTTGGLVQEFDPNNSTTAQVLPPTQKEISQSTGEESGTEGQFEGMYGALGTSFREAQWCGNHKFIAGIMEREQGETLIVQDMQPADGKLTPPKQVMTGEHIEIAINPKDGNIVYCVQNFQWPTAEPPLDKDGKPMKRPFTNAICIYVPGDESVMITRNNGEVAFGSPSVSADGTQIVAVVNQIVKGESQTVGLVTYPTEKNPQFKPLQLRGDIHEPSWSADGQHILAAVKVPGKPYTIYEIPVDGTTPRNITGDIGDFRYPRYSPQQKGP